MHGSQFLFFRGSTPTLELVLPLAVGPEDVLYLTLAQAGQTVLAYGVNTAASPAGSGSLRRDEAEENVLLLTLSQADSLALAAGDVELQLRLRNEQGADTFQPLIGWVGPARKEGTL